MLSFPDRTNFFAVYRTVTSCYCTTTITPFPIDTNCTISRRRDLQPVFFFLVSTYKQKSNSAQIYSDIFLFFQFCCPINFFSLNPTFIKSLVLQQHLLQLSQQLPMLNMIEAIPWSPINRCVVHLSRSSPFSPWLTKSSFPQWTAMYWIICSGLHRKQYSL